MARAKAAKKKLFRLLEDPKVAAALDGLKWKISIAGGVSTKGENVEILEPQHFECEALDAILDAAQGEKVTTGEKLGPKENRFLRPVQKDSFHLRTSPEELRFTEAKQVRERNPRRVELCVSSQADVPARLRE